MRIENPCDWVIGRLRERRPFFATRINDGEMICMYRTRPEGALLGTERTPAYVHYAWGDALNAMLGEMAAAGPDDLLIGCSWNTDRADDLGRGPFAEDVRRLGMEGFNWCNEHWPLDGVVDGSTVRLLDTVREAGGAVLVTCRELWGAAFCLSSDPSPGVVSAPSVDSWQDRDKVYADARLAAEEGKTFVWVAGGGLKPTAWRLFKEFPQSSHLDVGHLFNGAFGLRDYGWLQRRDGPWYEPYFRDFAPYVRRHLP